MRLEGRLRSGLGIGDVVNVSIFEAAGGGLFLPETSRAGAATIPPQQVDRSGNVTVPYAGVIRAVGRTTTEVQNEVEEKLKSRAIEPQAVVSIADQRSNQITILGEVGAPAKIPVEPAGTRLLSALARAGGAKNPAFETIITIQRGGAPRTPS
jgi:polysaccharide export outer membrane protein